MCIIKFFYYDIIIFYLIILLIFFILCFLLIYALTFKQYFLIIIFLFLLLMHLSASLLFINNLLLFILLLEFLSFLIYFLLNSTFSNEIDRTESLLKYFYFNTLGALLFIISICFLYFLTCDFEIYNLSIFYHFFSKDLILGFLFLFMSCFFFKIGIFPFFILVVDIYDNSNLFLHLILILLVKYIYIFLFLKFFILIGLNLVFSLFNFYLLFQYLVLCLIGGTFLYGTILTINTFKFKRFLAFLSIGHVILLLLLCFYQYFFDFFFFISFILFYILSDFFIYTFICCNIIILNNILYITDFNKNIFINSNNGFNVLFLWFILNILSLPPFLIFYVKFLLLKKIFYFFIFLFIVIILILSSLTVYYSIRLFKIFFISVYGGQINSAVSLIIFDGILINLMHILNFIYYNKFFFNKNFVNLLVANSCLLVYSFDLLSLFII